ncbi:MAG: hypothetical protein ABEI99_12490 [Halobaculum sp.]
MTTVRNGLLGGLVAGLLAAVLTALVASGGRAVPETPATGRLGRAQRVLVGVGYGSVAGGVFLLLELRLLNLLSVPPALGTALAVSPVWAGLLSFLTVAVEVAVGRDAGGFTAPLVFHAVYGLTFAAWIRLTWIT